MKKSPGRSVLLDRLHKGFVISCVGLTLYGVGHLGMRWYRYFTVLRPEAQKRELLSKQALLAEGATNADLLTDKAATIVS